MSKIKWPLGKDNPNCICGEAPNVNCEVHVTRYPSRPNNPSEDKWLWLKDDLKKIELLIHPTPKENMSVTIDTDAAFKAITAHYEQRMQEEVMKAKIQMLKNMKKSLVVAHQGGFFNGTLPIQLPKDAQMQSALESEFDRNIKNLELELKAVKKESNK